MNSAWTPKVSIVIPVYNGSNFMKEAIDSALAQTYDNIEIIVINDGSNDGGKTEKIALSYGDRIKYISKPNGGVSSALNEGIKNISGDYFSWLSHDDLYTPAKIQDSIDILRRYGNGDNKLIVYTDGTLVNEDGSYIAPFKKYFTSGKVYSGYEANKIMTIKGALCGCCLLIPKEAFETVGLFDERLRFAQDMLMWNRLFLSGYSICSTGKRAVLSRVHKNQVTNTRRDLFVHDSLYVAKILAPQFAQLPDRQIYYFYAKRLAQYECDEAFDFVLEYARERSILPCKMLRKLRCNKIIGRTVYFAKQCARRILMEVGRR